ncbi:glycosyltransferase family 4 protein [Ancylomarina sp. DW003]|nr:glycosyltransferase family 4 protein [Ancylomarina sp. DW003]MDE5421579.1 glycosyltransferase family 4 protein [Ancylomarina sp. DW003]
MKICLHTNWEIIPKYIGGTERFLINLSKDLKALGHEPFIVCSSKTKETYIEGIKVLGRFIDDFSTKEYPYFSSAFIKNEIIGEKYSIDSLKRISAYTLRQLEGIDADIYHFNSFISASFIPVKPNYVVTNHENNHEYDWYWGEGFFNFLKESVFNKETYLHEYKNLFTPSSFYASYFSQAFNINVNAINLGVPLNTFLIEPKENELKKEYAFDSDEIVILLPSRFQPFQKGHDVALKACAILKNKGIKFKVIFTGVKKSSEKYRSGFDDIVFKYNLQKFVKVITFPEIQEAYRNVDIVISPERYCSFGLSISESLSLGIPTVLSDIPTYKEIATGFNHAFFFKNESPENLAEKLIEVTNNLKRFPYEAVKFRMKYDLRECAKEYSAIYIKNALQSIEI